MSYECEWMICRCLPSHKIDTNVVCPFFSFSTRPPNEVGSGHKHYEMKAATECNVGQHTYAIDILKYPFPRLTRVGLGGKGRTPMNEETRRLLAFPLQFLLHYGHN